MYKYIYSKNAKDIKFTVQNDNNNNNNTIQCVTNR